MHFLILWGREKLLMSKWLPPTLLWVLCAVLWLAVAVDRPNAGTVPVAVVVTEPSLKPKKGKTAEAKSDGGFSRKTVITDPCVNVNQATPDELVALPGVGPVIAQRIIAYRKNVGPFTKVADLKGVKGIGPVTAQKIGLQACF